MEKCKIALKLYQATDYKQDFGFIDFVTPVRQQALIEQLDAEVFAELQELVKGNVSDLHIALPDILSPEEGVEAGYFGVGLKSGRKQAYTQIAIEDYVEELKVGQIKDIRDMAKLRASHEIRVIADGEGDRKQKRRLYDCFVYELTHKGDTYVLFAGDWFVVDKALASTKSHSERDFIAELDAHEHLLNLDQVKLSPANAPGANLEPDFLSATKQFIHLKDGHSSALISHLWNQGVVSAESFVRDEKFRIDLRKEVKRRQTKAHKAGFDTVLPDGRSKPAPSDYTVVFGIMREPHSSYGCRLLKILPDFFGYPD